MNHDEVRNLLDAYLDAELDLVTSVAVERHLAECADCTRILQNRRALRDALHSDVMYFQAPPMLERRIQSALGQPEARQWLRLPRNPNWLGMVAALLVGMLLSAGLLQRYYASNAESTLAQTVLDSHIQSLMANHLEDVQSTDQHTVKPWFDGKVDFAPTVIDLASQGFPLIGGRLDYLDNRTVVALVYQRQKHIINLFVWPADSGGNANAESLTDQGYHLIHWTQGGTTYWAVSDLEMGELQTFTQFLQAQLPG